MISSSFPVRSSRLSIFAYPPFFFPLQGLVHVYDTAPDTHPEPKEEEEGEGKTEEEGEAEAPTSQQEAQ